MTRRFDDSETVVFAEQGSANSNAPSAATSDGGEAVVEGAGVHAIDVLDRPGAKPDTSKHAKRGAYQTSATTGAVISRSVSKVGAIPARSVATVGRAMLLFAAVVRFLVTDTLTLKLPFGEVILQAWALLKVTAIPAVLMAVPFGAMVAVQLSGLMNAVGANALVGSATGVAVLRQGAPITAGLLMGGAAAAAIASDFGARAIREELDALRALGIDPVQRLVVPRFLALLLITPILVVVVIAMGVGASFVIATMVNDVTPGSFWLSFGAFTKMVDVWFTLGKGFVFAAIVAVISSLRGMEAKGGSRGVADAVNAAVVLNVICIVIANLAITQLQSMFFPMAVA